MPRSRSLVASPDPASFCSCRLLKFVVSCHIGHPNRFLVPSRAPSNLSVYQLCHLVHHRTCLSTNHATSGIIESFFSVLHIVVPISSSPFRSNSSLPILLHHHRLHSYLPIALIVLVPVNIAYVTSI